MALHVTPHDTGTDTLHDLLRAIPLPRWAPVRVSHDAARLDDVAAAVAAQFGQGGVGERITAGGRVALTAGSRGIDRIDEVLRAVIAEIKQRGGEPFIVPAMGSHGGATAKGQCEILARYGVTEAQMGCPIRAAMDVIEIGQLPSGERLYTDRIAVTEADLIVPVGRVKVHTDFHGEVESGVCKMLTIGLGKQHGADSIHASGFENFASLIPTAARFLLERLPVPFGIAVVDNGYGDLALVEAIPAERILTREAELLHDARWRMAQLPIAQLDVLVVDWMGKEISGAGMDPNVLGRYYGQKLPDGPDVQRIVVLDLTDATDGNATGMGLADICTARLEAKVDRTKTYINQITSKTPEAGRLPLVAPNDCLAIQMAIACLHGTAPDAIRLLRIHNTRNLTEVWASEALLPSLLATGRAEQLGALHAPVLNADGNLW